MGTDSSIVHRPGRAVDWLRVELERSAVRRGDAGPDGRYLDALLSRADDRPARAMEWLRDELRWRAERCDDGEPIHRTHRYLEELMLYIERLEARAQASSSSSASP